MTIINSEGIDSVRMGKRTPEREYILYWGGVYRGGGQGDKRER